METYNKIMLKVWLVVAILLFVVVTYMCITDDFKKWGTYYTFVGIALVAYFAKRIVMKKMEQK